MVTHDSKSDLPLVIFPIKIFFFTESVIDALVRILGCACNTDDNMNLSLEEVLGETCVAVQNHIAGQSMDAATFELVDQNGDGEIDYTEAFDAFQYAFENYHQ